MAELEASLGAAEYERWKAYYRQEPWGTFRDNLHAAQIASTVANYGFRKPKRAATVDDFLIKTKEERSADNRTKLLSFFRAMSVKGKPGSKPKPSPKRKGRRSNG